jgi:hypothetical protein
MLSMQNFTTPFMASIRSGGVTVLCPEDGENGAAYGRISYDVILILRAPRYSNIYIYIYNPTTS